MNTAMVILLDGLTNKNMSINFKTVSLWGFLMIMFGVLVIVLSMKRRSKQNSIIQHSHEETIEITKRRLIKDVVLMIIGIILLIRGINCIDDLILFLLGIIGGIFAFAYLIAALSNLSKYLEYKDMNAVEYKNTRRHPTGR